LLQITINETNNNRLIMLVVYETKGKFESTKNSTGYSHVTGKKIKTECVKCKLWVLIIIIWSKC